MSTFKLLLARGAGTCNIAPIPMGGETIVTKHKAGSSTRFHKDRRRKHRHWQVTVYYHDGEKFARVYIDRERAEHFAERQKKSPIVKSTRIVEVD
jgi:hypothetical protein